MKSFQWCLVLFSPWLVQYTISQQSPRYRIPAFNSTVSVRTNLCGRQRSNEAGNITLARSLEGLELSVVFLNYSDPTDSLLFTLNEGDIIDPTHPLLLVTVMDELAQRAGFTWRNSFAVTEPLAKRGSNKTYTDLLEWEVKTFDIAAGRWDKSLPRIQRSISFPEGFYDASLVLVSDETPKGPLQIWSLFLPFRWSVWIMTIATIAVSGIVYWYLDLMGNSQQTDQRKLEHKPGSAIFYAAIAFTGHFEFRPRSAPAMIMTFSLTFASLLFTAVYTANLASFLVVHRRPKNLINSVQEAVILRSPICVQDRVNANEYLAQRYPRALFKRKPTQEAVYQALFNNECRVAVDTSASFQQYQVTTEFNKDCNLTRSDQVEYFLNAGFATAVDSGVRCTSLINNVLDLHFLAMKSDGTMERIWQEYLERLSSQVCQDDQLDDIKANFEEGAYSLGLREMAGVYVIHAFLIVVALVVAVLTRETKRRLSRRKLTNQSLNSASSSDPEEGKKDEENVATGGSDSDDSDLRNLNHRKPTVQTKTMHIQQVRSFP